MRKMVFTFVTLGAFLVTSCDSEESNGDDLPVVATCNDGERNGNETGIDCGGSCTPCETAIENPTNYTFERNGESTVNFSGQTIRIQMANELLAVFGDNGATIEIFEGMFAHEEGGVDFENDELNASDKSIRSKTAASADYFSTNATGQALIRADFDRWIQAQVEEVFPNWEIAAAAGTAGQLADGERTRYVSGLGLEYDQVFAKGLIGALMTDQTLNNYLSTAVLDEGDNRANNDANTPEEGKPYTTMEHKWDEAYGYVYGLNEDSSDPNADLGADRFLNEYIERLEADPDFAGIADEIFQAFKLGRAAIVAKNYSVRDEQAAIIREKISQIPAVRAIYYLQAGKRTLAEENPNYGSAFHALSEAYGFIYGLQFTRKPGTEEPYFSREETEALLADLMDDGENGFWDVTSETLDTISETIASRFDFTVQQAAE
ncbi:DUF4856 domain-containing protein [Pareuzebyella sediminis]|uniref:DUF4856 domain-containing protein n=1 Tax=Pareuzebyella sediminis TaxID=2607998 RepID=UPI001E430BBE|nr:DUF4856 domain-containing protein [Pareuzebyella sediminis]